MIDFLHIVGVLFVIGLLSTDKWFNQKSWMFRFGLYAFTFIAWPFLLGRFIRIQYYRR